MPSLATVPLEQLNLICVDLETTGSVPPEILQLSEYLKFCIRLVLRQQIADLAAGRPATKLIALGLLAPQE